MIEDSVTLEGESAIPLEGIALGVDHLEALVVFLLSAVHTYATWVRPHSTLSAATIASVARDAYFEATNASAKIDPEAYRRRENAAKPVHPSITIEDPDHLTVIHRVRSFGVAMVFEREAPLGLARAFAQRIVATLEHDLPYVGETKTVAIRNAPAYEPPVKTDSRPPESAEPPRSASLGAPRHPSSTGIPAQNQRASSAPQTASFGAGLRAPDFASAANMPIPEARPTEPGPVDLRATEPQLAAPRVEDKRASETRAVDARASQAPGRGGTPKPPAVDSAAQSDDDAGPDTGRSSPPERYAGGPDTMARPGPTRVPDGSDDEVAPSSIAGRARRIIALMQSTSVEPHIVLLRLGLRTGLGLEPLLDAKALNAEAVMLLETAAEDMLGVDHDGLQSLLQKNARGATS